MVDIIEYEGGFLQFLFILFRELEDHIHKFLIILIFLFGEPQLFVEHLDNFDPLLLLLFFECAY
jgi:hypothetical protein